MRVALGMFFLALPFIALYLFLIHEEGFVDASIGMIVSFGAVALIIACIVVANYFLEIK